MEENKKIREVLGNVSKLIWHIVGICIIVAVIAAGLLYLQQKKQREVQLGYMPEHMTLTDERAYREIDWVHRLESDIVYVQDQGKNGKEDSDRERIFAVIDISGSGLYYGLADSVVPGCVIVHGTEDTTVRFSNGEKVAQKLENRGVDV